MENHPLPEPLLFPNCVTVFPFRYSLEEVFRLPDAARRAFALAAFPLLKHRWRGARVESDDRRAWLSVEREEGARSAPRSCAEPLPQPVQAASASMRDAAGRAMTPEAYAFSRCAPGARLAEIADDPAALAGIVLGGNALRLFSSDSVNAREDWRARSVGVLGNPAPLAPVPLASLKPEIQRTLFDAWRRRRPIVLTGGTGVGKTSQVPKLLLWFNYLFGGFARLDVVLEFEEHPLVLSLPRVTLVRAHTATYLSSLGFEGVAGSPVMPRHGAMAEEERNTAPRAYGLVVSTHRLTLNAIREYDTVVVDEIHEHDQMGDIVVAVARKLARGARASLVLMTATLEDDRARLEEFLDDPAFVHIEGDTLFPIREVYVKNTQTPPLSRRYTDAELRNVADALGTFVPEPGKCGIVFVATVAQCAAFAERIAARHPGLLVRVVHGKVPSVADVLAEVYAAADRPAVLVSTPYLESSVTVRTATHIYDTGRVYVPEPFGGRETIVSRAMYTQRRGRVGRVAPGTYVRFFDTRLARPLKRIDSEFLHPYVLYARVFGLSLPEDLLVVPSDLALLRRTEEYVDGFGLGVDRWAELLGQYYLHMLEYAKVYARGGRLARALDEFERSGVMTAEAEEAVRAVEMLAAVSSVRKAGDRYRAECVVLFGPFAGRRFAVTGRRRPGKYVLMVTDRVFIESGLPS
ncbi:putative RNA helicase NPH-II [Parapoxvirus red deer/HL953]|uniref:RNA helicase NPH-II n=1 Tax=Parapoxvirus red deer/HL953 TaxID=1579460 RepID=A0A0A7MC30_9POXV|nr:putative RNA helicase NPH-II [Parapoxvirus red deer/HL953]AIZ77287.1 putative RNA helicase NPH-II [Parapoxvirus red deer/HL953]